MCLALSLQPAGPQTDLSAVMVKLRPVYWVGQAEWFQSAVCDPSQRISTHSYCFASNEQVIAGA